MHKELLIMLFVLRFLPRDHYVQSYLTEHPAAEALFAFSSVLKADLCFHFAFYVLGESLQYMSVKEKDGI